MEHGMENGMKKRILFFLLVGWSGLLPAQTVQVLPFDSFDLEAPPAAWSNSTFFWTPYPEGRVLVTGRFVKGKKQGTFLFLHWIEERRWVLVKEENYHRGVLEGYWMEAIPHGSRTGSYRKGKKQGLWTTSADTTEEVWYKQDIRHGKYELSDQNYTVTGYYKKGKKQGIWTTTYRDPRVEEQVTYRNDVKHGKYIHTASGSCRTGNYRQGLKEGTWIFFRVSADGQRTELYREIYVAGQLTDRIPADREVGMKGPE